VSLKPTVWIVALVTLFALNGTEPSYAQKSQPAPTNPNAPTQPSQQGKGNKSNSTNQTTYSPNDVIGQTVTGEKLLDDNDGTLADVFDTFINKQSNGKTLLAAATSSAFQASVLKNKNVIISRSSSPSSYSCQVTPSTPGAALLLRE